MQIQTLERLTCVTTSKDTYDGQPLYKTMLTTAQKHNLMQATATKGLAIVTETHPYQTENPFQKQLQPIVVQTIGTPDNNALFLKELTVALADHIIVKEKIETINTGS